MRRQRVSKGQFASSFSPPPSQPTLRLAHPNGCLMCKTEEDCHEKRWERFSTERAWSTAVQRGDTKDTEPANVYWESWVCHSLWKGGACHSLPVLCMFEYFSSFRFQLRYLFPGELCWIGRTSFLRKPDSPVSEPHSSLPRINISTVLLTGLVPRMKH